MDWPLVTVIMPVRNEAAFIARSLGAVLNQDYPPERMEILIADGLSDDGTIEIIQNLPGRERVKILSNPRRIQAAGLNEALRMARGEFIVRVDGHTIIAPDYVRQCIEALKSTGASNVGGAMDPVGLTKMGQAIAAAGKSAFAVPSVFHISERAQYTDTVYLGAWPRGVFEQVGGYDETVGVNEDYELNYRIRQAGGKIYFSPAIRSQYYGRQTLSALARQYFRYGLSKVKTLRKHPGSLRPRQFAAPLWVMWLFGGSIPVLFNWIPASVWLLGVYTYAVAGLFFTFRVSQRAGTGLWWRIAAAFAVVHLAWGIGFWIGLLRVVRMSK